MSHENWFSCVQNYWARVIFQGKFSEFLKLYLTEDSDLRKCDKLSLNGDGELILESTKLLLEEGVVDSLKYCEMNDKLCFPWILKCKLKKIKICQNCFVQFTSVQLM